MTFNLRLQIGLYFAILLRCDAPLGTFTARVYGGDIPRWMRPLKGVEHGL